MSKAPAARHVSDGLLRTAAYGKRGVLFSRRFFANRAGRADRFTLPAADAVFLNDCGDIRNDDGIRRTGATASAAGDTCAGVDDVWNQG